MKEYNWDEMELKYFGPDYKIITPQEKAKIILKTIPLDSGLERLTQEGASMLNNEKATEVYRLLIDFSEAIPEALDLIQKAKLAQRELRRKQESDKK